MKRLTALILALILLSSPAWALTEEEQEAATLAAGLAALSDCVQDSMSDVETLTAIHDWLALHCDYGHDPACETAYGALVEGSASCRGYAAGLAYLASLAGLDGAATFSEALNHAWILATLDGSRYFCDCTWDDGKYARLGLVRHTYWLFDENTAGQIQHHGWDSEESVPGGPLENAPWGSAVTQVIFLEDWAYYFDTSFRLIRCRRSDWKTETLLEMPDRWPDTDLEDSKEPELYTGLNLIGERLFFNTPDVILSADLTGSDLRVELTPDTSERLIYGTAIREGQLCYSLADAPDAVLYDVLEAGIPSADDLSAE